MSLAPTGRPRGPLSRRPRFAGWIMAAMLSVPAAGSAALLSQISPLVIAYAPGTDFTTMTWSGVGDVTAVVSSIDLQLGLGNASTSGCEAADFAGFAAGSIALIQRGACEFGLKAANAEAAGAVGVLIFNQGNTSDDSRLGLINGTLTDAYAISVPVLFTTYALGASLALDTPSAVIRMAVSLDDPIRPPEPVPEPGTLALLGIGLTCAAATRRRRIGADLRYTT